jgi:uncharacterized protein
MPDTAAPPVVDVRAFAFAASRVGGETGLSRFERLVDEAQGDISVCSLRWSVQGEMRAGASGALEPWLHLVASACIPLTCQRCLGPVDTVLEVERSFRFVDTEALAEKQDEESEEDVLVLSPDFSLANLIEDEFLLALPLIPRHDTCPSSVQLSVQDPGFEQVQSERRNPFAALAGLGVKSDKPPR